jgi:hypothetical protein
MKKIFLKILNVNWLKIYRRLGRPYWILNCSEKQEHFLMTAGGTFLASLLTLCAAVLEKKSKMS